jgi:flagellar basal-body rod protein FlgG
LDPANTGGRPVNLQVGLGVRPVATARLFTQGNLMQTNSNLDFAIQGPGFFVVRVSEDDDINMYTRDGSFKISVNEDGEVMLVTSQGLPVLSMEGEPILFPAEIRMTSLQVDRDGIFSYLDNDGELQILDMTLGIAQFSNVQGLQAMGGNLYAETPASGAPLMEGDGETPERSELVQGYLEASNINMADEMIGIITTQRAFDFNSRVIQASDEMLQGAANLRR